ncbi:hypothetical protein BCR36DRAFT_320070 [Piromyces finnis]|uniref:Chitin-binding type-1 domain-containing protein n=1 Tax=Piromyces finnis TaxID=1754191 RepID=A0A1Y1VIU8_9FUNG|nr:hypothetical protein BCR36DRAFT_320070 [Piromyces finnis]|eukprot:ORX56577.1 hypothetical protein BCR36DRAFT_320070 [Piromyces finnis]
MKVTIYICIFILFISITHALKCGEGYGNCPTGQCCSAKGYCGKTTSYCSSAKGCQPEFGTCKCSGDNGICNSNHCCSAKGYCGATAAYCSASNNCQSEFGKCKCGPGYGKCPSGQCCGKDGFCGKTEEYCSTSNGCQSEYGDCRCGSTFGSCGTNQCCSAKGYCGTTAAYCLISNNCQSEFGNCKCGPEYGKCPSGQCCGKDGFCGKTEEYCSTSNGCQSEYGDCRCGSTFGSCGTNQCCSAKGYCGKTTSYCSSAKGCQPEFGTCKCSGDNGICNSNHCCSAKGYCGATAAYCSASNNCQSEFGNCKCGPEYGKCPSGQCCSKDGFCGKTEEYCSTSNGCQSEYGDCRCGSTFGSCGTNQCCSAKGYCGTTAAYCLISNNCQSEFGNCKCGPEYGKCPSGQCCGKDGFCGKTEEYCSTSNGCQSEYGDCRCGSTFGSCGTNQCCSAKGYCGKTTSYCSSAKGCQPEFGTCKCSGDNGICNSNHCCSAKGYCGTTDAYCLISNNCQSEFGNCKCGPGYGKCPSGHCCSKDGFCGKTFSYCALSNNCQLDYGTCIENTKYKPEVMKESFNELQNPYRGCFHGSFTIDLTDSADTDCNFIYTFSMVRKSKTGLQYLGVRLSEYYDSPISTKALEFLDYLLNEYRKRKEEIDPTTQIILRFYYDSGSSKSSSSSSSTSSSVLEERLFVKKELDNGEEYITNKDIEYMKSVLSKSNIMASNNDKNDIKVTNQTSKLSKRENGKFTLVEGSNCYRYSPTDKEPENIDTILTHIDQLSSIVNKYKDVIYIYQGVFVGRWGEMHSTKHATSLISNTKIMEAINEKFDNSIFLAVRTPCHHRAITNEIKKKSSKEYEELIKRLSLYNDGLFYSETDTGTYSKVAVTCFNDDTEKLYVKMPRKDEVDFQKELCLRVPNGGEVLSNIKNDEYEEIYELSDIKKVIASPDNYNNFYVCENHSENIHLSYYNDEYDRLIFNRWNITFSKQIYQPNWNKVTAEEYMNYHLGYRYVLRDSFFENNTINISLENIGFAPAYKYFQSELLFKSTVTNDVFIIDIDTDNRDWVSNKSIVLSVNLESLFSKFFNETYDVFFNLFDPHLYYNIKFANANNYQEDYGYKIGQLIHENSI